MTDLASERRAFEAQYRHELGQPDMQFAWRADHYYFARVEDRWQGWLARSTIPEITEERVEAGARTLYNPTTGTWPDNRKELCEVARACLTAALSIQEPKP